MVCCKSLQGNSAGTFCFPHTFKIGRDSFFWSCQLTYGLSDPQTLNRVSCGQTIASYVMQSSVIGALWVKMWPWGHVIPTVVSQHPGVLMASQGPSIPAVPSELMLQPHNAFLAFIRILFQYSLLAVILTITTIFIHTLLQLNPKEEFFF